MKTKKHENQEKWRQIVSEAESYPAGLAAYCRNKGIPKGPILLPNIIRGESREEFDRPP